MAIKVDLEKAYNRLRWSFIFNKLKEMGIPSGLISIIMKCVTTVSVQIAWNGEVSKEFPISQGIWQGDPISPYLFVLCLKRLAHLINQVVANHSWRPIQLKKDGPKLSHLFFANDLTLFAEANMKQVEVISQCLDRFCLASGQRVSKKENLNLLL